MLRELEGAGLNEKAGLTPYYLGLFMETTRLSAQPLPLMGSSQVTTTPLRVR